MAKLTQKDYFFPNASFGLYLDLIHYFAKDSAINNEDHGFFFEFSSQGQICFFFQDWMLSKATIKYLLSTLAERKQPCYSFWNQLFGDEDFVFVYLDDI